ncbi:hypothetical protein [Streptomyces sp. NPDC048551]|uniref:hypothetical protein n=1 Tax=Streptomyces sp. NPDC048551 TaxID=3155758 RepID=UPI003442EAD0
MARKHVTTALAAVGAAFILCVGLGYLFALQSIGARLRHPGLATAGRRRLPQGQGRP